MAIETQAEYGERVKAARMAAGLTLRELADRCGVDFTSLSHLEHGRFKPSAALGLALTAALGTNVSPQLVLTTRDCADANGRKPKIGEQLWEFTFPLDDGRTLIIRAGKSARANFLAMLHQEMRDDEWAR